jgi:hypothetical protein
MNMVTSIANWRCVDEWVVANTYTLRQAMHICEVYMREKFMVVNVLTKIFAGSNGDLGESIRSGASRQGRRSGRGLPSWFRGGGKGPVVDLDGELGGIRNTVAGMFGGK